MLSHSMPYEDEEDDSWHANQSREQLKDKTVCGGGPALRSRSKPYKDD